VTDNSLAFDVTVTNASAAAYLCVAEASKTPTAEEVLQKGSGVRIGNKVTQTVVRAKNIDFVIAGAETISI
jgi:hypothetical protein